jgi:phosphoribosylamine--glycine ligase
MQILLIGSGAREHALAWKLTQSPLIKKIHMWPFHPAIKISSSQHQAKSNWTFKELGTFACHENIDLVICGPEKPLAAGLYHEMKPYGIKVFGPSIKAAQLESSKIFAKTMMKEANIPTAPYDVANTFEEAKELSYQKLASEKEVVLKANGLAAGKGVFLCSNKEQIEEALKTMKNNFPTAAEQILIESKLYGRECSYFALINGTSHINLGFAVDFKRLGENDQGPNTGGMGAYTPVPWLPKDATQSVTKTIIEPLLQKLRQQDIHYCGFLYCGLMWTDTGPKVIEFNVRLGDPEAQALAVSDKRDWLSLILSIMDSSKSVTAPSLTQDKAVAIVMASNDYPYCEPKPLDHNSTIPSNYFTNEQAPYCFGASLQTVENKLHPKQGRILTVVGKDPHNLKDARLSSLSLIKEIEKFWPTSLWRSDIAQKVCAEENL